jgi:hypothetical protein
MGEHRNPAHSAKHKEDQERARKMAAEDQARLIEMTGACPSDVHDYDSVDEEPAPRRRGVGDQFT